MAARFSKPALLACTALALLASAGLAVAQEEKKTSTTAEEQKDDGYLTPIILTGGEGDAYGTAQPRSHVSADEIEQFGGKNLDDVLRATPGTFTRDNVQNPGLAVNIRGLEGSGRVNMMIDGVRQNFRFTGHEAQGLAYVDPAFLGGVDITRGYGGGAGSGNSLAGSVNFKTLDAADLIEEGRTYGGFATATYGTNRAGWSEAIIGAVRPNDAIAITGGLSKRDPGNYRNGDGDVVGGTEQDVLNGLFKVELTPSDAHSLKLTGNLFHDDFLANSYYQTIDARNYALNYAYTPGDDLIDFRANAYLSDVTMQYDFSPIFPGGGSAQGRNISNRGTGFDLSNTSRFDLGEVAVSSTYGVEFFQDIYDVVNSRNVADRGVNGSGKNQTTSVFSSTTFSYGITDLTLGLRHDSFHLTGDGSVAAGNPVGLPAGPYSVDRSEGRLNPSATLALKPVDWFQPYVTYAETSRGPTVNEIFMGGSHPSQGVRQSFFPNPFLEPETSRGWEVGANVMLDGVLTETDSLRFKANYFHNRIENYITAAFSPTGGAYFRNNAGESTVQGVELQAAYDSGDYFASAAYTYTDSQLPSQVNGLGAQSYVPDHVFSATLGARFLEDQSLTVGSRFYAVSESYVGEPNVGPGEDPHEPGYGLVDLFANYRLKNGLELSANVVNLFDETYTPALSTPPGGSSVDTGRGRTFLFTAKATF